MMELSGATETAWSISLILNNKRTKEHESKVTCPKVHNWLVTDEIETQDTLL